MTNLRVGHGYDVHALARGLPLTIGGVRVDHTKGFVAHSDGDVLVHAICDALLGAMAQGDIGSHFPDTSPEYAGVDSLRLLAKVMELLATKGYQVVNIDTTIVMQTPKLRPYIDRMRNNIAHTMGVELGVVSIKATTEERLGFTGREEGVSAYAVVLICKI